MWSRSKNREGRVQRSCFLRSLPLRCHIQLDFQILPTSALSDKHSTISLRLYDLQICHCQNMTCCCYFSTHIENRKLHTVFRFRVLHLNPKGLTEWKISCTSHCTLKLGGAGTEWQDTLNNTLQHSHNWKWLFFCGYLSEFTWCNCWHCSYLLALLAVQIADCAGLWGVIIFNTIS